MKVWKWSDNIKKRRSVVLNAWQQHSDSEFRRSEPAYKTKRSWKHTRILQLLPHLFIFINYPRVNIMCKRMCKVDLWLMKQKRYESSMSNWVWSDLTTCRIFATLIHNSPCIVAWASRSNSKVPFFLPYILVKP